MSNYNKLRLLTPPKEEEEIYPYRRVWRSIGIESVILLIVMLTAYIARAFFGFDVATNFKLPVNIALALSPSILWLFLSRIPENFVPQPRRRLLTVFTVSALVANAIGIPLVETLLRPEEWLPQENFLNRIIGYMLTIGILQEFLKYLVVRYIAFPEYYRVRSDSIAYGIASAMGYALVINLNYVMANQNLLVDALMMRVFAVTTIHILASVIVAYGLSETLFNHALSVLLPVMLLFAALVHGLATPLRTSFMNVAVSFGVNSQRSIFGILFSIGLYAMLMFVMLFLFNVADQREQDRFRSEEA